VNTAGEATVTLLRFDPSVDTGPRRETYKVPADAWNGRKIIDVIRYIYENFAPGLSFREPCCHHVCGSCTIMVNKKPVLACNDLARKEMIIEPLTGHRVIKDLAVEM
jgi:succinate dehydrogenase/fumarate reductase iron-sulfur protein